MAQTSDELRREIEETRDRMGETVDASRTRQTFPHVRRSGSGDKKDAVTSKVSGVTPDGGQVKQGISRTKSVAERNPLGLAIGGAAVGFVVGLLAPSTRMEDQHLGEMADDVKSSAAEAGREAVDRGKQVVKEASQTALDAAKEQGKEQSEEMSSSLQDKARELTGSEPQDSRQAPDGPERPAS